LKKLPVLKKLFEKKFALTLSLFRVDLHCSYFRNTLLMTNYMLMSGSEAHAQENTSETIMIHKCTTDSGGTRYTAKKETEAGAKENISRTIASSKGTINSVGTRYINDADLTHISIIKVSRKDFLKQLAWKIKQSKIFLFLYIIVIMTNAALLYLVVYEQDRHWIILGIEASVNFVYLLEIVFGILNSTAYFSKWSNLVDVIICLLCWVLFGVYLEESYRKKYQIDIESEIDVELLTARYTLQTLRVFRYIKTAYTRRCYLKQEDVVFDSTKVSKTFSDVLV